MSSSELSQVDAAVMSWKQICPLYREVTAQLCCVIDTCCSTLSLQHPVVTYRHLEMEAGRRFLQNNGTPNHNTV